MSERLHDERHWYAVAATGLDLAETVPGADRELVLLFGLLHDSCKSSPHAHGRRAAELSRALCAAGYLELDPHRLDLLCDALEHHAYGHVSDDPTIGVSWDADRLHLTRVHRRVRPELLSTNAAREPQRVDEAQARCEEPVDWPALRQRAGT